MTSAFRNAWQAKRARTELDLEHLRAVARLDEHDLVLVRVVERALQVLLDGDVEDRRVGLHARVQLGVLAIDCRDDVRPPEPELQPSGSWEKDRTVVDRHGDNLLARDQPLVP